MRQSKWHVHFVLFRHVGTLVVDTELSKHDSE